MSEQGLAAVSESTEKPAVAADEATKQAAADPSGKAADDAATAKAGESEAGAGAKGDDDPDEDAAKASEAGKELARRKHRTGEYIERLKSEKAALLQRAKSAEERLAKIEKAQRPDPAKFTDPDEYETERTKFAVNSARKSELQDEAEEATRLAAETRSREWQARVDAFNEDHVKSDPSAKPFNEEDLASIIRPYPGAPTLAAMIMDSDLGVEVAQALTASPREAARLAQLSPIEQAREIGRIEARVSQPIVRKITAAPEPVKTVGAKTSGNRPDYSRMSNEEYAKVVAKESARP